MTDNFQEGYAEESQDTCIGVTPKDVIRFNKARLRRAKINLENARNRRDIKAAANIQRKIAIYQWTIQMAQGCTSNFCV